MKLVRIKKVLQQVIKDKRQQVKVRGDNSRLHGEIRDLVQVVNNIEYELILVKNKRLKKLLGEGLVLMERLEEQSKGDRRLYNELKRIRDRKGV